jgi:hypothetical protein
VSIIIRVLCSLLSERIFDMQLQHRQFRVGWGVRVLLFEFGILFGFFLFEKGSVNLSL